MSLSFNIRRVGLWRALLETLVLGTALCAGLLSLADQLTPAVLGQGVLFLSAGCALIFTLRLELPEGNLRQRIAVELGRGTLFGLVMVLGVSGVMSLLGFDDDLRSTDLGVGVFLVLLASGPGFIALRIMQALWFYWNSLRRRKLVWALVHAQLTMVLIFVVLLVIVLSIQAIFSSERSIPAETSLAASLASRLILTVLPMLSVSVVMVTGILVVFLPPTALISYWIAHRITRRLDALTRTTSALRGGDYNARVYVSGEDEVAQLQGDFNAMATELESTLMDLQAERDKVAGLLRVQRELSAAVSHELRTPVATIQGYLEPALERWEEHSPEALRADLEVIHREVDRLRRLIDDLFTLSQAEVGALDLRVQPVDVVSIARRMVDTFAPLAWGRGRVEVIYKTGPSAAMALADEGRLEQILANLLRNAIRHTPPGGIVAIQVANDGDSVRLDVSDTGEGIPADELSRIWKRFYRLSTGEGRGEAGAGLGLALVKELTEAMGGHVTVESIVSQGSCFTVRLPISTRER